MPADIAADIVALTENTRTAGQAFNSPAYRRLSERGDVAVPALETALIEGGLALDEMSANLPTDSFGHPSYAHLDPAEAERIKASMTRKAIQQNVILRLLQTNNSPRAQSALRAFRETRPTRPAPDVIIMDPDSKPLQVWPALQQVVLCGRNDEASRRLALARLDENEHPMVRAQALLLAADSGLGEQVRPIALEMTKTTARSSYGTHMYVLLATAQLISPEELRALMPDKALHSSEVDVIMLAAQFYHADDDGKDALIKEAAKGQYRDEIWLKRLFFQELLQRGRGDSLVDLGYIRRGGDGQLLIAEDDQRLIRLLGYGVSADEAGIKFERLDCW